MAIAYVKRKGKTNSFHKDNYARRQIERVAEAVNNNAALLKNAARDLVKWGTYTTGATSFGTLESASFTRESGVPSSISGATRVVITVSGTGQKYFNFTFLNKAQEEIGKVYDGGVDISNGEYVEHGFDLNGFRMTELRVNSSATNRYAFDVAHITDLTSVIGDFTITQSGGSPAAGTVFTVYAEF